MRLTVPTLLVLGALASLLAHRPAHSDDTVHVCLEVKNSSSGIAVVTCPPVSTTNPFPVVIESGGSGGVVGTSPISFQQTVTASAVALAGNAFVFGPVCTALTTNAATIYVGPSGVTTSTGYPLIAGQSISYAVNNSNLLYIIGTNTSDVLACTGN